jgi:hypothetical protein
VSPHAQLGVIQREPPAPPRERREALEHLRSCADCRAAVGATDPTHLFALLVLSDPAPGLLDRVSAGVTAGLSAEDGRDERRSWRSGLAIAASLLMAAVLGAYLLRAPDAGRAASRPPLQPAVRPLEARAGAVWSGPTDMIEVLSPSTSVGVVELQVHEARVLIIFDEGLDL